MAHRIDTSTALKDKFGVGKNGFTRGNPQTGVPATELDDDYFDMLQEEIVGIVEAAGDTLDKTQRNQLNAALGKLFQNKTGATSALGALVPAANRLPYFTGANGASLTDLTPVGRDILAAATKAAVLDYLGLGDGGVVSAGGGTYNQDFSFKSVSTVPNEQNGATLFSRRGNSEDIVSGATFGWYDNYYSIGMTRGPSYDPYGFTIQYGERRIANFDPNGSLTVLGDIRSGINVIATKGVYEVTEGDPANYVRVYSPNNPPPGMIIGLRMVRQSTITTGTAGATLPNGGILIGGNFDDARQYMEWAYLQAYVNGDWVTILW
ncbi:MAG TPA: hypothetical protein VJS14_00920 [Enterobacteriaceae bacterium]|nr:hypothetical protein [Enterobacteriaceae bacterium]